ncbi:Trafficking kinesin-binding protein 1, partial [Ophiophagus hannah]
MASEYKQFDFLGHRLLTDSSFCHYSGLLGEQLPLYKLRADTIFGYDHKDWIQTPQVSSDAAAALTFKQIEETLEYFCK